jgi:5-formyltetrahydrofolate cyclo-ligase
VLPALALDRFGTRLGQGGGYFDRALGELRPHTLGGPLRIGMTFAAEVVAHLPRQAHDQGVDLILTEEALTEVDSDYEG